MFDYLSTNIFFKINGKIVIMQKFGSITVEINIGANNNGFEDFSLYRANWWVQL